MLIVLKYIQVNFVILINKKKNYKNELKRIQKAVQKGNQLGLEVHAGHGLTYINQLKYYLK